MLPTPNLDDRHFQEIVDEAKRLIPRYCPEWTDHNVSDPGVALIELFAWMTDMLLFRVNQVPDKLYVKFLDMIGIRLEPPQPAQAQVTFYLAAAQPNDVVIPEDTEIATVRTETMPAIIFTTEEALTIRTPLVTGAFTRNRSREGSAGWLTRDLRQLDLPNQAIEIFPEKPAAGDGFYLALERDHSQHVLALIIDCELARGAGVDPRNPPWEWQVWQGGLTRWATCELEHDGTGGFNQPGEIILHLPPMVSGRIEGQAESFWLRCRLTSAQSGDGGYEVSPKLKRLEVELRGGTTRARHAVTVRDEVIGRSDGTPGQQFRLLNMPILSRNKKLDRLVVEPPHEPSQEWQEVPDFACSGQNDLHYTLDSLSGVLMFGPSLLQPEGNIYRFGATPPQGSLLRFSRYQYGGGVIGNIPKNALSVLKTSIPYVARVANRQPSVGGRDAQSLADAKLRAPQVLRTRTRAMTTDDYEYLAGQVAGVARARCIGPGAQPGDASDPKPGQVFVVVLPQAENTSGSIPIELLNLSADLRAAVLAYLNERRPLGVTLDVRRVRFFLISVKAKLRLPARSEPGLIAEVKQRAEDALYRYLNPYTGGPQGQGWPFDRDLHVSEISGLLQRIPQVEFVEEIQITMAEPGAAGAPQVVAPRLLVPRDGLVCSGLHSVDVEIEGRK